MSDVECVELGALEEWLSSFPQLEEFVSDKENNLSLLHDDRIFITNPAIKSAILEAVVEICNVADNSSTDPRTAEDVDVWLTILSVTRKTPSNRRKSIDPPTQGKPHHWKDCNKHTALGNLLSIAVSHKDLQLRKAYIERIMMLSPATQRSLMSMIEKRKKLRSKSKKAPSPRSQKKPEIFTPGGKNISASPASATTYVRRAIEPTSNERSKANRKGFLDNKHAPEYKIEKSANGTMEARGLSQKSQDKTQSTPSSPNFLRRPTTDNMEPESEDINRRTSRQAFGSPLQLPSAKRIPPPSSERNRNRRFPQGNVFSPGLGDTVEYESQVQDLRDENKELSHELKKSRQKEEEFSRKIEDLEEHYRKEILQVERQAREHDDNARQKHHNQITQIETNLKELREEYITARKERDDLAKIKDEMEVMSHNKVLLEETTERLRTYKEKVQHLTDVKDTLQREEEAHSRSVEENLRLQNELNNLQPLKKQLDEYKARAVDAEVRFTDCQDELNKLKEQKMASSEVSTQMEQYVIAQEVEIKELRRRVQQNDEASKASSGVGDGMSELNPELKEEMFSLRNENEQLRAFAEKRQEDAVSKLEQDAEDQNMLAERYKVQFLVTKDKLESTESSLVESQHREEKLREDVSDKTQLGERLKSELATTKDELESTESSLADSINREKKLQEEVINKTQLGEQFKSELGATKDELESTESSLANSINREKKLQEEVSNKTQLGERYKSELLATQGELESTQISLADSIKREANLQEEVSNKTQLGERYKSELLATKDQLESTEISLVDSINRETKLQEEVNDKTQFGERYKSQFLATKSQLESTQRSLQDSKTRESSLRQEVADSLLKIKNAQQEIEDVSNDLSKCTEDLKISIDRESKLEEELATWTSEAKDLQHRSNNISLELTKKTNELAYSHKKESGFVVEVSELKSELRMIRKQCAGLGDELKHYTLELEQSQCRESKLEISVKEWMEQAHESKEHAENISSEHSLCIADLKESKQNTARLEKTVLENSAYKEEADREIKKLTNKLSETTESLEKTCKSLDQSMQRYLDLQNCLSDMTSRAEGAENISMQRMELVQTSRDQLETAEQKIVVLVREKEGLAASVEEWISQTDEARTLSKDLEDELKKTQDSLKASDEKLSEAQAAIEVASREKEVLTASVAKWTLETEEAKCLSKTLNSELCETVRSLNNTAEILSDAQALNKHRAKEIEILTSENDNLKDKISLDERSIGILRSELLEGNQSLQLSQETVKEQEARGALLSERLQTAEDSVLRSMNELLETKESLKTSKENTKQAEEREISLNEQLNDAEDSIQNLTRKLMKTKECLQTSQEVIEEIEQREISLNEQLNDTEDSIQSLEKELQDTKEFLRTAQENTKEVEQRETSLNGQLNNAEDSIERLKKESLETKKNLEKTQEKASALETKLNLSNEQLQVARKMTSQLENSVEREVQTNKETLATLEEAQVEKSELKKEFESRVEKLSQSLKLEKEKGNKFKQEISEVRDELSALEVSLSSSQHREKMAKHAFAKLEDKKRECEDELSGLKSNLDETVQQSSKSLESIREIMNAKAEKELEELKQNMNQHLEDERKAKLHQDVLYKEQINKLNQQYNQELLRLKESSNSELANYAEEKDKDIERLKKENEKKIKALEMLAANEKDELMERGKGMMKDIREQKEKDIKDLTDDVNFLEKKIVGEEEEKRRLAQQFQSKIIEYKKKLQSASGRINTLSTDNNEFEDRVKHLERESFKLREENDRYRRQLGGRSGSDSALQSQLETLQNEFKNAIDENRELKRKLQGHDLRSLHSIGEDSRSTPYTRNRGNQSTLLQLRAEYEETIESLNDEKRELIMKNSAAITDVQKAEKRAWLVEQDNAILKQDVTSLKLSNERLESVLVDTQQNNSVADHTSFSQNDISAFEENIIPKPPTPEVHSQFDDSARTSYGSQRRRSRDNSILGMNQGYANGTDRNMSYDLAKPDYDTKRSVQSTTSHSPFRNW